VSVSVIADLMQRGRQTRLADAAICPPNTQDVSYVDDDGNYVSKNYAPAR
jgi:hypothetical protein